jgi:hypothetical protein
MSSRGLSTILQLAQANRLVYSRYQLLAMRVELPPSSDLEGRRSLYGARQAVGRKCTANEQVRQLIRELSCNRATRGRRAGTHDQANRRRQLIVSSYVICTNQPGKIPAIIEYRHVNQHPTLSTNYQISENKEKLKIDSYVTRRPVLIQVDISTRKG